MKIFGSISELVDLAFRLAGGKQVKLRSATQTTSGNLVTVNVPDVAATGDTQNMVLTAATQSLSNKTLSSPTISGGTINNSIIGGSTPAAGSFTDIVGSTLDINTSAELQTLTIPSLSTAGVLHNNSSGVVSSSLIVDGDITNSTITLAKLASIGDGKILVGANSSGDPTARTMSGDVTISNLGVTTIGASKVTDGMLAGNITRTKLATGNNYRILANDSSGQISENAALTPSEAVATDANGQLVTVTGVSATELGYLSAVTSDIQAQLNNKQAADATLTTIAGLAPTTDQYIYFTATDTAATGTITSFGRSLVDDSDATAARSTLGLGSMATQTASSVSITGGSITGITDLAIADGGTGASTQQAAINALAGAVTSGRYLRGDGTNVSMSTLQAGDLPSSIDATKIGSGAVSNTEFGYLDGVTSAIQTQIDAKAAKGANSDITSLSGLTTALSLGQGGTGATTAGGARTNLGLGGMATQDATSVNITGGTIQTTNLQNNTLQGHKLGDGAASIASSTLTPVANKSLQLIATAANFGMIASPAAGQEYVLVNESSSDITIQNLTGGTAANQIYTGTGADFTFKAKSAIIVVYDGTLSKWMLIGGGGGAGGLATSYVTAGGLTAVNNTHYLTNLSASGQTITLPSGTNGSVIRFSDAGEVWDTYPLTIVPATGEKIDKLATNETLVCDVKRGWVELSYNSTFGGWALMSLASTSGSAAGSGEINAVLNPTAASGTTGWTGVTQVSSGSPLDPIVSSAFSISNVAGAESSTSGGYYSIASMPSSLRSKKLKVSFYYSTPATDVYKVSVYAGSTRLPLSSDAASPTLTVLPANVTGGYFEAYFDSTTASAYSLNITRTSGSTGACVITQVIVGPGINVQGAAISERQAWTPSTGLTLNATDKVDPAGRWYRVGSNMVAELSFKNGSGGTASGTFTIALPTGYTLNTAALPSTGTAAPFPIVGVAQTYNVSIASNYDRANTVCVINGAIKVIKSGTGSAMAGSDILANAEVSIQFTVPIAEWAGNGTVNLGGAAQVEYLSGAITSDASTSTTVYGPAGSSFPSAALSTTKTATLTTQYPIQADDLIVLEYQRSGGQWQPIVARDTAIDVTPYEYQNTVTYGAGVSVTGTNTIVVSFGQYSANNSTYGAVGLPWTSVPASAKWRVRKAKASAPVGFGLASATASGLVSNEISGTFTGSMSGGFSANPADGTYYYARTGKIVTIWHPQQIGTSNATTNPTISGLPAAITPSQAVRTQTIGYDNSTIKMVTVRIETNNTITVGGGLDLPNASTNTNSKGLLNGSFTYLLP